MFTAGLTSRNVAQLMPCVEAGHIDAEQRSMLRTVRERVRARAEELQDTLRRLDDVITVTDGHP
ncbi:MULTISPECIES: hypothetical protein [unclassified Brachybacterium]|uniref:hypothetical protein n=1 Tax=unclassified Brachybacterium TaxID=2623841 RepID=UPI003610D3BC